MSTHNICFLREIHILSGVIYSATFQQQPPLGNCKTGCCREMAVIEKLFHTSSSSLDRSISTRRGDFCSPEYKVLKLSHCYHPVSIVRRQQFL